MCFHIRTTVMYKLQDKTVGPRMYELVSVYCIESGGGIV
jgi:hypothetical protein